MQINGLAVMKEASEFANRCLTEELKKNGHLTEETVRFIHSPNFFPSQMGRNFIGNLILGALESYHSSLREKLLEESNIDIGEMKF